jgi:hypothetical protein
MAMLDGAVWSLIKSDLELLAKQIVANDPGDDKAKLDAELRNLEMIEKELSGKLERENKRFNIFVENPELFEPDYLKTFETKINLYNKKIIRIKDEKAKIKSLQSVKLEQLSNIDFVINSNLSTIENSKTLLKKYINIFVDEIRLQHHNKRFTIISVNFRKYGNDLLKRVSEGRAEFVEAHFSKWTHIILDKKQTLNIRAVKTNQPIAVSDNDTIQMFGLILPIEQIFENINQNTQNIRIAKEFNEFNFNKLDIYKNS